MDRKIEQELTEMLRYKKITHEHLKEFGRNIMPILKEMPEEDFKNNISEIFTQCLRKGPEAYNNNQDSYAEIFKRYIVQGIHPLALKMLGQKDGMDFSIKVSEAFPKDFHLGKWNQKDKVVKSIAVLIDKIEDRFSLPKEKEKELERTVEKLLEITKNCDYKEMVNVWNDVHDELILKNYKDIIPQLAVKAIETLDSRNMVLGVGKTGDINRFEIKNSIIHGLSDLKNKNIEDINLENARIHLFRHEEKSPVEKIVEDFFKDTDKNTSLKWNELTDKLTGVILTEDNDQQFKSWTQVRTQLEKQLVIENYYLIIKQLSNNAKPKFETEDQKKNFIDGIMHGVPSFINDRIKDMRDQYIVSINSDNQPKK